MDGRSFETLWADTLRIRDSTVQRIASIDRSTMPSKPPGCRSWEIFAPPPGRPVASGAVADEWADRCPACNAGLVEIGEEGSEQPIEVLCAGPEKHFFPVLDKRAGPGRYRLGDQIDDPTEYRLGDEHPTDGA
jgi:hypothetical protein